MLVFILLFYSGKRFLVLYHFATNLEKDLSGMEVMMELQAMQVFQLLEDGLIQV